MKYKVGWLIDGIVEIEAKTPQEAEKKIDDILLKFMRENTYLTKTLGAKAIQGTAYLPGPDDKDEIIENED